ncbi:MAG: GAF domain-containing protein, partial [candidate division Zixibacteria bacterium]|nr:GAF domain-containing protein [candidate division Zixibacteria bacterium]
FIVDDEERMCNSLASLLRAEGYDVETFQQSEEAAEAIRDRKVDLVLSDIKMPVLSGLDLLKIAAQIDDEIPVILMTGYASLHSAVEAVSLGAYDYLLKPIEFADLALVAKRALEKRRSDLSRRQLMEELKLSNMILNRRINELNALYEAGKSIGSTVHLRDLLKQIVTLASSVTEAQTGSIMLLDDTSSSLTIEAAIGLEPEVVEKTVLPVGESIAGFVAETGEPLIVSDVENDERFRRINREKYGSASLLCVPLLIKNKVIGVINMANKEGGAVFSDGDFRLLTTFASQAAVAVDDAYQFERNRRRLLEFEILHEVSREVPNTESVNEFRRELVGKLQRVFHVGYSIWFRWDAESDHLIPSGVSGETTIPVTSSGGIDLRKISQDHISLGPINLDKINLDEIEQLSMVVAEKLRENDHYVNPGPAFMAVPVKQRGELTNVFCLGSSGRKPYTADDISLAQLVISQSAVLFEKERSLLNTTRLLTMGNMISEISHDLRKPLTSIKGGLQVLRKRWPDQAESSEMFQMAESEIQRLNELVRELVDFSNP